MNDYREEGNEQLDSGANTSESRANIWPGVVIVALILVAGLAIVYAHTQRSEINAMSARTAALNQNVAQLQDQLQSTTAKLNDVIARQQAGEAAAQEKAQAAAEAKARAAARQGRAYARRHHVLSASEERYNALRSRLDAQQKEIEQTNQSIAKTRSDLQASLDSTASGLNGSIAKNHAELVALEKRGERSYFEFDLYRSKEFFRTGPISLSLRHADTKHKRYNMVMLVDDNRLEKKNVDLYEPVWISSSGEQPLEIVVNKITKNHIHGYISAPKYSTAELNSAGAALQPVSATTSPVSASNGDSSGNGSGSADSAPAPRTVSGAIHPSSSATPSQATVQP